MGGFRQALGWFQEQTFFLNLKKDEKDDDVAGIVNFDSGFEFHPRSRSFQKITTPLSCDLTTDLSSTMASMELMIHQVDVCSMCSMTN